MIAVKTTVNEKLNLMIQDVKARLLAWRVKLLVLWASLSMVFVVSLPARAQSIAITPDDLDVFFEWFNTMFSVILPIALIGAGLVAGATFAFVVGTMLKKAFQSLAGSA